MEKKRGRPCKYVQVRDWERWLRNDWKHARMMWRATFWLVLTMWAVVIGKLLLDFFVL